MDKLTQTTARNSTGLTAIPVEWHYAKPNQARVRVNALEAYDWAGLEAPEGEIEDGSMDIRQALAEIGAE